MNILRIAAIGLAAAIAVDIGIHSSEILAAYFSGSVATAQSSSVPTGAIVLIDSGSCPAGYAEVTGLNARDIRGTLAANGDVGGTGGNDSYTPAGTVAAPTFTGSAGTVSAQTISYPANVPTLTMNSYTPAGTVASNAADTAHTHPAPAFTGSAATLTGTIAWPANPPTNGTVSFTPAGTNNAPAFTGSSATVIPAYLKLIGCKKT